VQFTMPRPATPLQGALPTGTDVEVLEAGVHWDAVCVPAYLGDRVLTALDTHAGAVIRDPYAHLVYFLILPGAAGDWRFPDEARVRVLGSGSWVGVPPAECFRSSALCWARPVVNGRVLTGSCRLHAAMQTVIADGLASVGVTGR
jgi:hypothetical protein